MIVFFLFIGRNKINLNEISHDSASGLVTRVLNMGVLLTEVIFLTCMRLILSNMFLKFRLPKKHMLEAISSLC